MIFMCVYAYMYELYAIAQYHVFIVCIKPITTFIVFINCVLNIITFYDMFYVFAAIMF